MNTHLLPQTRCILLGSVFDTSHNSQRSKVKTNTIITKCENTAILR